MQAGEYTTFLQFGIRSVAAAESGGTALPLYGNSLSITTASRLAAFSAKGIFIEDATSVDYMQA